MNGMIAKVRRLLLSGDGPTAVEYAVMLALVTPVLLALVKGLSGGITGTISTVSSTLGP
jgi:pilus assembly protein Flp/PilA